MAEVAPSSYHAPAGGDDDPKIEEPRQRRAAGREPGKCRGYYSNKPDCDQPPLANVARGTSPVETGMRAQNAIAQRFGASLRPKAGFTLLEILIVITPSCR